ncbi:MAG: 50S ribosomal protein L18, partial [Chloroflexi bacterium]|nr:50S ribosomal protein L18 [Chloroflexota bacterium]
MIKQFDREAARRKRHRRIRVKVRGTTQRPRLSVFRSLEHIYAQVIDDDQGRTLLAVSTMEPEVQAAVQGKSKVEQAQMVGKLLAERAQQQGIATVVFDRGGYQYHGR